MKLLRSLAVGLLALQLALVAFADGATDARRAAYLKVIERPRVAPRPVLTELAPVEGLKKYHLWFYADATERVPGYLV